MKVCTKCGVSKEEGEYSPDSRNLNGLQSQCKHCKNTTRLKQTFHGKTPKHKICTKCGKDKVAKEFARCKHRGLQSQCKLCLNTRRTNWRKSIDYSSDRRYERLHPELRRKCKETYHFKNKNKPKYKLNNTMRRTIWNMIRGYKNNYTWESLVGYTVEDLKKYLESQFQEGMTWDNYGKWHIDHKIPASVFNFDKPEQIDFKRCWALKNLRPIWAKENIIKRNKLQKHFQPMLKLRIG